MAHELLNPKTAAWPATLAGATILGSLALACVFPFAAIAALAALTLDRRSGIALVGAVWAANQAVGFLLMNFPWDAQAVGHRPACDGPGRPAMVSCGTDSRAGAGADALLFQHHSAAQSGWRVVVRPAGFAAH